MKSNNLVVLATSLLACHLARAQTNAFIPWDQIGAKAGAACTGDGLVVSATASGARLHCAFQRLDGEATCDGLWLTSSVTNQPNDRFRVTVAAINGRSLPRVGKVAVVGQTVRFTRPGLVEEYSVSVDGVRQDFVVLERPDLPVDLRPPVAPRYAGDRATSNPTSLRVDLAVTGARVEQDARGAQLKLPLSGRKIAYTRLKVTDANGMELLARIERAGESEIPNPESEMLLAVVVNDTDAVYPLRIDPTFSDANWISMGSVPGADGGVYAIAADGSGNIYIGGYFSTVGDINASGIAKWDGSTWSALGSGMGDEYPGVYALAVSGSNVYAGGYFTTAGGVSTTNIARWDGNAWSALGSGMNGEVYALAVSDTNVYAGGRFTTAGGIAAVKVAKWDGSAWSSMDSGMGDDIAVVYALAVSGSDVYAGGCFTAVGGVATTNIAKWNGSFWSPLDSGVGGDYGGVYALVVSSSDLYAGGCFTTAGGVTATNIARWDGNAWSALGSGVGDECASVQALAMLGGDVYAAGTFTAAGGTEAGKIAKWSGGSWSPMGSGMNGGTAGDDSVHALAVLGSRVYAGGEFLTAGGVAGARIAEWDRNRWSALSSPPMLCGMNDSVRTLLAWGDDLYVGGSFRSVGGLEANCVAKWNGNSWSALGSGMDNGVSQDSADVSALAVSGSFLYAGGYFATAGGVPANNIAKWNGSTWSALGSGVGVEGQYASVFALAVSGGDVYAGGYFTTAGGLAATNIAKWNGSSWSPLGSNVEGEYASVQALAVSGDDLYVGGSFITAGGVEAANIAKWNGSAWSPLGSGVGGKYASVSALVVSGGDLYAGGSFITAGGVEAANIARWDGNSWSALGTGVSACVHALKASGGDVYAGGDFTMAGGDEANYIAKWDGSDWSALGSGMNMSVYALGALDGGLYAGGGFTTAGGKVSAYLAKASVCQIPFFVVATNSSVSMSDSQFSLTVSGPAGFNAVILASSDLHNWMPLVTNELTGGLLSFSDPQSHTNRQRFYRAVLLP
jgi:hypothetical protein